jgi:hypothetical protein
MFYRRPGHKQGRLAPPVEMQMLRLGTGWPATAGVAELGKFRLPVVRVLGTEPRC